MTEHHPTHPGEAGAHTITTLPAPAGAQLVPTHGTTLAPAAGHDQAVIQVTLPGRTEPTWAYPAHPLAADAPAQARPLVPRWALTTAVLAPALTGSAWLGALALSQLAVAAATLAATLAQLALALAVIAIVVLGATATVRHLTTSRKTGNPAATHVTVNSTANRPFSRASVHVHVHGDR